jgi:hypothetical protein
MQTLTSPSPTGADEQAPLGVMMATNDYVRRIHWWVRLFGVVWLASLAFGLLVVGAMGIGIARDSEDSTPGISGITPTYRPYVTPTSVPSGGFANRHECMQAFYTTTAQCNELFPLD